MEGRWALRIKIVSGRNLVARDISGFLFPSIHCVLEMKYYVTSVTSREE